MTQPNASSPVDERMSDSVLNHMRIEVAKLGHSQTIGEALSAVRANPPIGRVTYFYVIDDKHRLVGVVPTRQLLLAPAEARVEDLMIKNVITLGSTATVLDACEFFVLHRLLAFPVVDERRRLLGVVDIELYTEELSDLDSRDHHDQLFQLIGVHVINRRESSPLVGFKTRFPWLTANIIGGILSAVICSLFEPELKKVLSLALFIPIVLALAESVSIQSLSLALQRLRGERLSIPLMISNLKRESLVGMLLGAGCGLAVALVALVWLGDYRVALCLSGGIVCGVSLAAVIGQLVPNLIRLFHKEPQVAAGPLALCLTDVATLLAYFLLARVVVA